MRDTGRREVAAHRQSGWVEVHNSAGPPPDQPVADQPEEVALIAYGSARIRIAGFPIVGE